ncbi:MAG: hypothetical protein QOD24_856 [Solirubrobacteraceae bacterium]|jgi:hypothetical protein|nr:hypothetical protein [Solirubrobacteraceae bacterium]
MPRTSTPSGDDRRAAAQQALRERAARIARLRRQVLATALGTFVLAFAVIAFDGSMGSTTKSSAAAPVPSRDPSPATTATQPAQDPLPAAGDTSSPPSSASSSAPLTTSQS